MGLDLQVNLRGKLLNKKSSFMELNPINLCLLDPDPHFFLSKNQNRNPHSKCESRGKDLGFITITLHKLRNRLTIIF